MEKILHQWHQLAAVGIVSLIGWGVNVMPGNTSWVPSIIIWGIAFVWLVFTIGYLLRRKGKGLKTRLGNLLLNGETLILGQIDEVDDNTATGLVNEWIAVTIEILNKEREEESSYFLSNAGLEEPITLKRSMRNRLARLKDIFERL